MLVLDDLHWSDTPSLMLLRGLTQNDVSRFIEVTSGMAPPATLVGTVHTQTEGDPLLVTGVVRLLVQENLLTVEGVIGGDSWSSITFNGMKRSREVFPRSSWPNAHPPPLPKPRLTLLPQLNTGFKARPVRHKNMQRLHSLPHICCTTGVCRSELYGRMSLCPF